MPLEIRELIIKATVDNGAASTSGSNNESEASNDHMINEIAEKVLEILREKSER